MPTNMIRLSSRAPRSYRAGDKLSLDGLHVYLVTDTQTRELSRDEYRTFPEEGTELNMDYHEKLDEKLVTVFYDITPYRCLTANYTVSVTNDFRELRVETTTTANVYAGMLIPIRGVSAVYDADIVPIDGDPISLFNVRYLSSGVNNLSASYTSLDKTITRSISLTAENPRINSIVAKYDGGPVFSGSQYDKSMLSATWTTPLTGVPEVAPGSLVTGTFSYADGKLSVDRDSVVKGSTQVKMCLLSDASVYCYFDVGIIPEIERMTIPESMNTWAWDKSRITFRKYLSNEISLFDSDGNKSKMLPGDRLVTEPIDGQESMLSVPSGNISVEIPVSVYVSRDYPEKTKTVSSLFTLSVFRYPKTIDAYDYRSVFTQGSEFDIGPSAYFEIGYSNGDTSTMPMNEKVKVSPAIGTSLGLYDTSFSYSYSETVNLNGFIDTMTATNFSTIEVIAPLVEGAIVVSPTSESPGSMFVGDKIDISSSQAIISVKYAAGAMSPHVDLSSFAESKIDSFVFEPETIQFGDTEVNVKWTRTVIGHGESIIDMAYPIVADYNLEGAGLSIVSYPQVSDYYEGQTFNPDGLSVSMVFGNGYSMDVTNDIIVELSASMSTVPLNGVLSLRYVLTSLTQEIEYTAEISVNVVPKLVFEPMVGSDTPVARASVNPEWLEGSQMVLDSIDIPSSVTIGDIEYDVTELAPRGFAGCSDLVVVNFPDFLAKIGESCFMDCVMLGYGNIPVDLVGVGEVGQWAFANCVNLGNVSLPLSGGISELADHVFYNTGLNSIHFSESISSIGEGAFANCHSLTGVVLPPYLESIGTSAFAGCESMVLADMSDISVTYVPDLCFRGCQSILSLGLSPYLNNVGASAFYGCSSISGVTLGNVSEIGQGAFENCSSIETMTITGMDVNSIGKGAFAFTGMPCEHHSENLVIFFVDLSYSEIETIYYNGISEETSEEWKTYSYWTGFDDEERVYLKDSSFSYVLQLDFADDPDIEGAKMVVGAHPEFIGSYLVIPPRVMIDSEEHDVTRIADNVFKDMEDLENVKVGETMTSIGNSAFEGCSSLSSFTLYEEGDTPRSMLTLESSEEEEGSIPAEDAETLDDEEVDDETNGTIPQLKIDFVGNRAFAGTALDSIDLPKLQIVGSGAFENTPMEYMDITNVVPPDGIELVDWQPFRNCHGLTGMTVACWQLPMTNLVNITDTLAEVEIVGGNAEEGQSTVIIEGALSGFTSLSNVEISAITRIEGNAFYGCSSLKRFPDLDPSIETLSNTFAGLELEECVVDNDSGSILFHVPGAMVDLSGRYELPYEYLSVMPFAVTGLENLLEVEIPDTTSVDEDGIPVANRFLSRNSFFMNPNLASLSILEKDLINDEEEGIFTGNESLTSLTTGLVMGATPRMISGSTLESVTFLSTVNTVWSNAFENAGLKSIDLGESIRSLGDSAFAGNPLTSIIVRSDSLSVGVSSIHQSGVVTNVEIPGFIYDLGTGNKVGIRETIGDDIENLVVRLSPAPSSSDIGNLSGGFVNLNGNMTNLSLVNCKFVLANALLNQKMGSVSFVGDIVPVSFGDNAFKGCYNLSGLDLCAVTSIGRDCFVNCSSLNKITFFTNTPPSFNDRIGENKTSATHAFDTGGESLSIMVNEDTSYWGDLNNFDYELSGQGIPCEWASSGTRPTVLFRWNDKQINGMFDSYINFRSGKLKSLTFDGEIPALSVYGKKESNPDSLIISQDEMMITGNISVELPSQTRNPNLVGMEWEGDDENPPLLKFEDIGVFGVDSPIMDVTLHPSKRTRVDFKSWNPTNLSIRTLDIDNVDIVVEENNFTNIENVILGNGVRELPTSAFARCEKLNSVTIGNGLSNINVASFLCCYNLMSINIPNSVTSIGEYAFYNCSSMVNVTIPDSVTRMGRSAFERCSSLVSIYIPGSIDVIEKSEFSMCANLSSVVIGDGVKTIDSDAFLWCYNLDNVLIPSSVGYIYNDSFLGCQSIMSFVVDENNMNYSSIDGLLLSKDGTCLVAGIGGDVSIPNSVTTIGNYAFSERLNLMSISIPDSVLSIGYRSFEYCKGLTSITIPSSVLSIGSGAFSGCRNLLSVEFNNCNLTAIEINLFRSCSSLISVKIPDSVKDIGSYSFRDCKELSSIILGNSVSSIEPYAFFNCSKLSYVRIPDSMETIKSNMAFASCNSALYDRTTIPGLALVDGWVIGYYRDKLPDHVDASGCRGIAGGAFSNSNLTSIIIPNNIKLIDCETFENCNKLVSIVIPNSVRSIESYAFLNCSSLPSIMIPDSVTEIWDSAFKGCDNMQSLSIPSHITVPDDKWGLPETCEIIVRE